jgi:hypothetical protein
LSARLVGIATWSDCAEEAAFLEAQRANASRLRLLCFRPIALLP